MNDITIALIGLTILLLTLASIAYAAISRRKKQEPTVQDSYSYLGTGDPQFDEVATIAQGLIDDFRENIYDTEQYIKRAKGTSAEILETSLKLQRMEIMLDLLNEITFDNVMKYYGSNKLDWYTVGMVMHYVRRTIDRRLA